MAQLPNLNSTNSKWFNLDSMLDGNTVISIETITLVIKTSMATLPPEVPKFTLETENALSWLKSRALAVKYENFKSYYDYTVHNRLIFRVKGPDATMFRLKFSTGVTGCQIY